MPSILDTADYLYLFPNSCCLFVCTKKTSITDFNVEWKLESYTYVINVVVLVTVAHRGMPLCILQFVYSCGNDKGELKQIGNDFQTVAIIGKTNI